MTHTDLADRVSNLENSLRRTRWVARAAILALAALPLLASTGQAPTMKRLDVEALRLVDEKGKVRGEWRATSRGTEMVLFDHRGRRRVELSASGPNSGVLLRDDNGRKRVGLATDKLGTGHMLVMDREQRPRLHLAVGDKGAPGLMMTDEQGLRLAGLGVGVDGKPWLLPDGALRGARAGR